MPRQVSEIVQQLADSEDGLSVYNQHHILFLISHMRAYSTLLSQILGSNPHINGFMESRRSYQDIKDIVALKKDIRYAQDKPLADGYVLDKLIHNNQYISQQLLQRDDITIIVMIRKPLDSINSLYQTSERYGWGMNLDYSINYYNSRLKGISAFVDRLESRPFYLEAESLIDNTANILDWLSRALDLQQPLSEEYQFQSFRRRGKSHSGDPSNYIQQQKIIRQRYPKTVEIDPEQLQILEKTYRDTRSFLLANCIHQYED